MWQLFVSPQSLNEEILSRKKTVDQAIKNGQALLKQTTGNLRLLPVSDVFCVPTDPERPGLVRETHSVLTNTF